MMHKVLVSVYAYVLRNKRSLTELPSVRDKLILINLD